MNRTDTFEAIVRLGLPFARATKLELNQLVFPAWGDLGLLGRIFSQCVNTKEAPSGHAYDPAKYRTVLRVLGGKVYGTFGMPDAYAWSVETFAKKAKKAVPCGCGSDAGVVSMAQFLSTIHDEGERLDVAGLFRRVGTDLVLVTTVCEERTVFEVTQEAFDLGITACVDEWMKPDENGVYPTTELNVGDFLVINEDAHTCYCIRRDEFLQTHRFN